MAIILNDRDKALQAAPYRSKQAAVTITGTASSFLASKNTVTILPTSITLTATPSGSVYTNNAVYTWSYALSSAPNTWIQLSSGANLKTQVLNNTDSWVANAFVQYRCVVTEALLDTSYAYYTVTYTKEASDPTIINLSRSNVLVTCDSSGTPTSYSNTDQTITVSRGSTALVYSTNTTTPNSFSVTYTAVNLTASAGTGSGTTWTQPAITAIALDGATITYTITVYDSATTPAATTYVKTVVYNKVNNGTIGADGANLYPTANYDFAGATLPTNVFFISASTGLTAGTVTTASSGTTTSFVASTDQAVAINNLSLIPANSYIISLRVLFVSGTWFGKLYFSNTLHPISNSFYKTIPQPPVGVWTTINLDMRALSVGGTDYMTGGAINYLGFNLCSSVGASFELDYISIAKYGVAEATKSITLSMYFWANPSQTLNYSGAFTYTWNNGTINAFPVAYTDGFGGTHYWTSAAGSAPNSGDVLYQRNLVLSDVGTAATTVSNWNLSTLNTIGYRTDGTIGQQGDSYRIAYVVTNGVWTTPAAPTAGSGDVAPTSTVTVNSIVTSWSKTATATLTDGQYMYQTDGIYNASTTNITWGTPYLSNLKVGNLSAISANLGVVSIASGGSLYSGKSAYATASDGFFLGNDAGTPKFRIGNAANTAGMSWDGSTLVANALTIKDTSGNVVISSNTAATDIFNSNIKVNRNLIRGLHKWAPGLNYVAGGQPVPVDGRVLGMPAANNYQASNSPILPLTAGTYTLSFIATNNSGSTRLLNADLYPDNYPETVFTIPAASNWTLYTTTWTVTAAMIAASATSQLRFFAPAVGTGDLYIGNIKLEYGSINTPWCPNDADSDNAVNLPKSGADSLTGPISLLARDAIYIGTSTTGLYLGSSGMAGINAGSTKFSIDANGNATFAGNLTGATGEFAGTLRAGVLDLTTFAGISYTYSYAGTFNLNVPSGKTSMRVTLVGAGGGGGAGASRSIQYSGAGGGGGGLITQVFSGLSAGAGVTVITGAGGAGAGAFDPGTGQAVGAAGSAGAPTLVYYNGSLYAQAPAGGGGGGATANYNYGIPQGGSAGGLGATAGQNGLDSTYSFDGWTSDGVIAGGAGGSSRYGSGGAGGPANSSTLATVGGIGAGGGGGGLNWSNNNLGMLGANGGPGFAIIEFFDPNTVVLKSEYDVLKAALSRQGIAIT